ncbi:MAG: FecR domain-containing protein, partial [Lentisphaeraceae bacterium]|nr:FecR domain-containing protein [Lentisphaeraceae bacterium]
MKTEHRELIENYLQDNCSESDLVEISQLVENDQLFRRELAEAAHFQGLFAAIKADDKRLVESIQRNIIEMEPDDFELKVMESLEDVKPVRGISFRLLYVIGGIAAQVLIVFGLWAFLQKEEQISLGSLYSEGGRAWVIRQGERTPVTSQLQFYNGDLLEVEDENGDLRLTWNDLSEMHFEDSARLSIKVENGQKKLELYSGRLKAHVTKQKAGKPLLINTVNSQVIVLGTRFKLSVEEEDTLLEVQRGLVELVRSSDGSSVKVKG